VLASPPAFAQTITLGFAGTSVTTDSINQGDCNNGNSVRVVWTVDSAVVGGACNNLQIFVTNSTSCPDTPTTGSTDGGTADQIIGTVSITDLTAGTGTLDAYRIADMPGLGGSCPDGIDISNAVCASINYRTFGVTTCSALTSSTSLTLRYDAKPPVPPTMSLVGQDSKIIVQLGNNGESSVSYFRVEYAPLLSATDAGPEWIRVTPDLSAKDNSQTITGLTNDQPYVVRAYSLDEVLNLSPPSAEQTATPLASNGFWAEYKSAGGHELGGCSAADATVPSIVGALVVIATLLWRRR